MSLASEIEILLVEDSPYDAELTLRSLKKHNVTNKIFHVTDGEMALHFVLGKGEFADRKDNQSPKVIFLDLKLPKVDGLEVLRTLKGNPQTKTIPIVVLTSSKEENDVIESYQLGVNSYIVKPVDFEKFSEAVSKIGLYWVLLNETPNALK